MTASAFSDLPPEIQAAMRRAAMPDFDRWQQMINATGGCAQPVRLKGGRMTADAETGELIESYTTDDEPTGYLLTACGNRRASRCPACAETYRDDTYHLIIAGMQGGKGVPDMVSAHPRAFVTLTAPSFGAVHVHREKAGKAQLCRPRRDHPICEHGRPQECRRHHTRDDRETGQPLCLDCYDYPAAVLWNAHAPELWRRFTLALHQAIASVLGISRAELRRQARISYAKVIEYQRRGLIHFHAVIRLDGPDGPDQPPPPWATTDLLDQAVQRAATETRVIVPHPHDQQPPLTLRWGSQLKVLPIYLTVELGGMEDKHVAHYIAKYATKGAEDTGTVDRPIRYASQINSLDVNDHVRRMIWTCWAFADVPAYADLRLRQWAHMLGYRGHFSSKSRRYSTTLGALRQARADHQAEAARERTGQPAPDPNRETVTIGEWKYAGSGLLNGEEFWAESARKRRQTARHIRREVTERQQDREVS